MSAISKNDILTQIDKAKRKYQKISNVNAILDDHCNLPKDQRINTLVIIIKQMIDEQTKADKTLKLRQQKIFKLQQQLSIKNKMIQKHKQQLLQSKNEYFLLQGQMKNIANQLKSAEAQIIVQQQIIDNQKYTSNRKVLSMQSQVNFLLTKDCQKQFNKTTKSSKKRLSCIAESKQNANPAQKNKKKIENIRKSTAK